MLKVLGKMENILTCLAGSSIVVMMLLTTADATGRYIFNRPITGAFEITEKYFMTLTFLGICYTYRQGAHVRLTFLVDRVPHRIRLVIHFFVQLISTVVCLAFIVPTIKQIFRAAGQKTFIEIGPWQPPLWTAYIIIPLGWLVIFLAIMLDLRHVRTGKSDLIKERESEPVS